MTREELRTWREDHWEQEYETLMEIARKHLNPDWEHGEVIVLRTAKGNIHAARIPDFQNSETRDPLEKQCIQKLEETEDTEVLACLATISGRNPEIPSWNFREGLIQLNESNLHTETFLWGGGDTIFIKPFHRLLPPNYQIRNEEQNT